MTPEVAGTAGSSTGELLEATHEHKAATLGRTSENAEAAAEEAKSESTRSQPFQGKAVARRRQHTTTTTQQMTVERSTKTQ